MNFGSKFGKRLYIISSREYFEIHIYIRIQIRADKETGFDSNNPNSITPFSHGKVWQ